MAINPKFQFDQEAMARNYSSRVGRKSRRLSSPYIRNITPLYTRFQAGDIVENAKADTVNAAMWSDNDGVLTGGSEIYTSSVQRAASGEYYREVYREDPQTTPTAEPQFAMAFGHFYGSGSAPISEYASEGMTPTKAIYSQYRNLLLAPGDDHFTVNGINETSSLFINVNRQRFKERIDPGNWELVLVSQGAGGGQFTAGGGTLSLIDESIVNSTPTRGESGAVFKIRSGSIADGLDTTTTKSFGWFYPDMGVLMISPRECGWNIDEINYCWCPTLGSPYDITNLGENPNTNLTYMIGSMTGSVNSHFTARNAEQVYATHYFIRIKNAEYNFSNNPSFTSGSQGEFTHATMFKDPKVYITTVGMYNDHNELLAIAKLSKPLLKSFTREALIRVKLEF